MYWRLSHPGHREIYLLLGVTPTFSGETPPHRSTEALPRVTGTGPHMRFACGRGRNLHINESKEAPRRAGERWTDRIGGRRSGRTKNDAPEGRRTTLRKDEGRRSGRTRDGTPEGRGTAHRKVRRKRRFRGGDGTGWQCR